MWRNYVTVGWRALARSRTYAFINIFGLALGLAACLLILLYVRYETSYDKWLPDSDRIYQVQATWHEEGQPVSAYHSSPRPVRETIAGGFPQIEAVAIAINGRMRTMRDGQATYVDQLYVDPSFLDIFQLEFVHGSRRGALPNTTSILLTETEAIRQFGTTDAVGRIVTELLDGDKIDYRVTGVLKDLPKNSHLEISTILRFEAPPFNPDSQENSWGNMNQFHYVKLRPGADVDAINAALPAWEKRVIPPQVRDGQTRSRADIMDLKLVAVPDIHLGDVQLGAMKPGSDRTSIATFTIVALLILAMACVNFINLSTARAGQRAREVALRKVLGASRRQLVVQFLGESLLLALLGTVIALALVELLAPSLAAYLDIAVAVEYLGGDGILLPALCLTLIVGIVGGLYPAFYLSRFQPAQVLKANKSAADPQGSGMLRNALVVAQFAISIGLIACTWVVYSQTRFVQTADPGFEREGLVQVDGTFRIHETGNYDSIKREMEAVPGVVRVARTNLGVAATNKQINLIELPGEAPLNMGFYRVDTDFFGTMGMRLLSGRTFADSHANDLISRPPDTDVSAVLMARGLNIVINRKAAALLGFNQPAAAVGRQVKAGVDGQAMIPSTIVGVVEDTRIRTARDEIEPLVFLYDPSATSQLVIRYRSASPMESMKGVEAVWNRFFAGVPFEGAFAEDLVAELYERERRVGLIFASFALLAVVIACLGLFGLAAFTTERRTKEIGIRKVLGAKVRDIVRLLAWQFSKPVIIANLVAWPVAWWAMRDWLNSFDARIALTPTPFAVAGLIALAIAIGTVSGHALRVARTNPIHALRYE